MAKKKYYAVKVGKTPGVYLTWEECKVQVDGFAGALHKSFSSMEEAQEYVSGKAEASAPDRVISQDQAALPGGGGSGRICGRKLQCGDKRL